MQADGGTGAAAGTTIEGVVGVDALQVMTCIDVVNGAENDGSGGEFESVFAEHQRQLMAPALAVLTVWTEQQRQMAEIVTRYSQLTSASTDSTLSIWVVQVCVLILLIEVLYIGWSIAAAIGTEARATYMDMIGLIALALQISSPIKKKMGPEPR